jgi:CRISPR/Cas system-associated exonuclease Cas4 (RecB family)
MKSFSEELASKLIAEHGSNISKLCVVLPSVIAGKYFEDALSRELKSPVWLPEIYSIKGFIEKYSPYKIVTGLTPVFELFGIYRQFGEDESFEKFYPWGEMLLRDFDEIDKNLVDPKRLFTILREHKQIEGEFEFKVSDMEEFYMFWNSFSGKNPDELQRSFINTWEIIGKVYHGFGKALTGKGLCYEGMAYRRVYEMINSKELALEYEKIVFAGFNMLSKSEEGIFKELSKAGKSDIYWDTDEYYLDNSVQEAGKFLRKNFEHLGISRSNMNFGGKRLAEDEKNINVIGSPLQVSQAKVLGNELSKMTEEELNRTAVVIPEESLLLPVMYSIPGSVKTFNITMSFPFKNTPLYGLFRLLRSLSKHKKGAGASSAFYHKNVIEILMHPYIKLSSPHENMELTESIKKRNSIYVSGRRIYEAYHKVPPVISEIFRDGESGRDSTGYLVRVIKYLEEEFLKHPFKYNLELEYLYKVYKELNKLGDIIKNYSAETSLGAESFWNLVLEVLNSVKIPFEGEPLKGLQVMGMLETRLLDFDNVFILSVNEGVLPRGDSQSSFIPYHLRKAFGLPCFEDEDANTAYNFYRLLQRAKNVTLIYNTEPGELSGGEKSRFIMQAENELAVKNQKIRLSQKVLQADIDVPKRKEIIVEKTPELIEILKNEKRYSATILNRYIHCSLQFYLAKAAKLREEESVEEYFTGGGFGSLLHQVIDIIYRPYAGKSITASELDMLKSELKGRYDDLWVQACEELTEFTEFKSGLQGKNILFKSIIRKLVENILAHDKKEAPFKVLKLETNLTREIEIMAEGKPVKVNLFGRIDRIEEKDGITRIIDYKTGRINERNKKPDTSDEEHIEKIFSDSDHKENFQQLFYAGLYMHETGTKEVLIGLYHLQKPSKGIFWFEKEPVSAEKKELFENYLKSLLGKIFDSTTPFTQVEDVEKCKWCPYKSICYRD